ncbi:MAG: response regulator transcription factor, partial [Planctomycetota bacterium]|jgi:twitching motility two-component system response regulator PilH
MILELEESQLKKKVPSPVAVIPFEVGGEKTGIFYVLLRIAAAATLAAISKGDPPPPDTDTLEEDEEKALGEVFESFGAAVNRAFKEGVADGVYVRAHDLLKLPDALGLSDVGLTGDMLCARVDVKLGADVAFRLWQVFPSDLAGKLEMKQGAAAPAPAKAKPRAGKPRPAAPKAKKAERPKPVRPDAEKGAAKPKAKRSRAPSQGTKVVLVVDDLVTIRRAIEYFLSRNGYNVVQASNGEDALLKAEEHRPHAIVMDVMMPGMDGIEVVRRMRALPDLKDTPIIMCTCRTERQDVLDALRAGANDYVVKPFKADTLLAKISQALLGGSPPSAGQD